MNATSQDMKDHLLTDSGLAFTYGTDLFIREIPATVDGLAVALLDTGGVPDDAEIGYERPSFQVLVRGARGGYLEAWNKAKAIKTFLDGTGNETINSTRYIGIWANHDPMFVRDDDKGRAEFTVNFRVHRSST